MDDLISKQKVIEVLYNLGLGDEENGADIAYISALTDCKSEIQKLSSVISDKCKKAYSVPIVKSDCKMGKWITTRTWQHDGEIYCSLCSNDAPAQIKTKYCPNCGARMQNANTN